jgi:alkylation response protein AidB-like acyl-CoA dehydrogenase
MDFRFSDEQQDIRELARGILEKELTRERLRAAEATDDRIDTALWKTLAAANLLGVAVPEAQGGMGQGLLELLVLLEEIGRAVAPIPALPALVLGGLPIARFGNEAQREAWLRPLVAGAAILSGCLPALGPAGEPRCGTRAFADGGAFVLEGFERLVPGAGAAACIVVPASNPEGGVELFLVDRNAPGVLATAQRISTHEPLFDLALEGVRTGPDARLAGGADALRWLHDVALVALCALQVGVSERAIEITAQYVRERKQFGVPIGSFQAVQHRLADCWIDLEAMRWTCWRAASRLADGLDVSRAAVVAKFWAAEAGSRIANAAQHLHGGLGADLDYPIHRHFLWSKSLELSLGGASPQLARLGRDLARGLAGAASSDPSNLLPEGA